VLLTGSEGLIGRCLKPALEHLGYEVRRFDRHLDPSQDMRDPRAVRAAVGGCDGIVHLAAVSRVVAAERDPETCWAVNVAGTRALVGATLAAPERPWLLFSSSREVYGQPERLPVAETSPLRPVNIYGRSKLEGERQVLAACTAGLRAGVVRFTNVYGSVHDHADRVVPAFARIAAYGGTLRVDGGDNTFDFTHLEDTVRGVLALVQRLAAGVVLPPVHLATGIRTSLATLAALALSCGRAGVQIHDAPSRSFDVDHFCGATGRAQELLGWRATVEIADGFRRLVADFRALSAPPREHPADLAAVHVAPAAKRAGGQSRSVRAADSTSQASE
jgi:nucleoside-diphosphate-sugar epimerase